MRKGFWNFAGGAALSLAASAGSADAPAQQGWFVEASVLQTESSDGEAPLVFRGEETGVAVV